MGNWAWLNLVWIVPYFCVLLIIAIVWLDDMVSHRYVRKVHTQLYGRVINNCILCPVCETFIYGRKKAWRTHLKRNHFEPGYYAESLSIIFNEARGKIAHPIKHPSKTNDGGNHGG